MADSGRDEKLAAARKKLKKFQQKRTPNGDQTVRKETGSPLTPSTSPIDSTGSDQRLQDKFNDVAADDNTVTSKSYSLPESDFSSTEKIRQICNKLNGLMNEDLLINGDPVINEIELLERKNQELEENVQSHKRSNLQLNTQVNEQRKQIIQLQEQIKRERNELANRQLLEQRSLKEQLEVHIQTIGILVSEKQDLQSNVTQLQRKYQIKENENTELNGRLQTLRQRVAELERNTANLSATCEKQQEDLQQLRQDKNKSESKNIASSFEKEELCHENAELKEKLAAKVDEVNALEKNSTDLSFKLKQAELIVQQLSSEPSAASTQSLVQQLQEEKKSLDSQLKELNNALCRLGDEKGELLQRHSEEVEQYCNKISSITEQLEVSKKEREDWEIKQQKFQETILNLEHTIAELQDKEAAQQSEFTQVAATEIERLSKENERMAFHLRDQNAVVARLEKSELEYQHQIHELQVTVGRLEENCHDKASLLESIQSDKETISRALKQNKDLKTQLEELQECFVKMSNENMELAMELETEKHVSMEVSSKMKESAVELEEAKLLVDKYDSEKGAWDKKEVEYHENILSLQKKLAELKDSEAANQLVSEEVKKLTGEREKLSQSLREQVNLSLKEKEDWSRKEEDLRQNILNLQKTIADLKDSEALQQSQFAQVAASEIEKITKEKDQLSKSLEEQEEKMNLLVTENNHLKQLLEPNDSDSDRDNEADTEFPSWDDSEENEQLQNADPQSIEHNIEIEQSSHVARPYMNGYNESPEETDSSEEMNMVPRKLQFSSAPPSSMYTKQDDVIDSLSASVRQLEMEREQLTHVLQSFQEQVISMQEHVDLQLRQQLQQQHRTVQEHFQEQLHELQQKIRVQHAVIEKQKEQIEKQSESQVSNITLDEEEHLSHEALKIAFSKLQARFIGQMEEKAVLADRIADLEHQNVQLAEETETIGEYITLYQTQRRALKLFYRDRERLITKISNEKADMQAKIVEFQDLVRQLLGERRNLQAQALNLQNIVNSRMSAHQHEREIPGLQDTDQLIVAQANEDSLPSDNNGESKLEPSASQNEFQTEQPQEDATAQQILHLLEQLGPEKSLESVSQGNSVATQGREKLENHEFHPCRYCSPRLLRL